MDKINLYTDGSVKAFKAKGGQSTKYRSGGGWVIEKPETGLLVGGYEEFGGFEDGHEAELAAITHGIKEALNRGFMHNALVIYSDSQWAECIKKGKEYFIGKNNRINNLANELFALLEKFPGFEIHKVSRNHPRIELCDILASIASSGALCGPQKYPLEAAIAKQERRIKSWEAKIQYRKENGLPVEKPRSSP